MADYALWRGYHPDGRPYRAEEWPLARAIQKGEVVDGEEADVIWPGGERRTLRLSASPVRGADGQILAGVVICQDVTAEKAAHTLLADSEARFRSILENSPAIIFMKDGQGRYIVCNPALARFLGRDEATLLGRTDFDVLPGQVAEHLREADEQIRQTGDAQQMEEAVDGRVFLTVTFTVLAEDGSVRFVGGISTDITDRKQAEAQLRSLTGGPGMAGRPANAGAGRRQQRTGGVQLLGVARSAGAFAGHRRVQQGAGRGPRGGADCLSARDAGRRPASGAAHGDADRRPAGAVAGDASAAHPRRGRPGPAGAGRRRG